jgi:hypothetical protein
MTSPRLTKSHLHSRFGLMFNVVSEEAPFDLRYNPRFALASAVKPVIPRTSEP